MGFMTDVSILNDRWDEIRRNPKEFIEQVFQASLNSGLSSRRTYVIGQTTVAPSHHADTMKVYCSHRNSFIEAYPTQSMSENKEWLIRHKKTLQEMKKYLNFAIDETNRKLKAD